MAPLKFEDKMKDKLEQRTIKPSEGSWEKLAEELNKQPDLKRGSKKIWWYSVAAVFIGIMILSFVWNGTHSEPGGIDTRFVDTTKEVLESNNKDIVETNIELPQVDEEQSSQQKNKSKVEKTHSNKSVVESLPNKSAITYQSNPIEKKSITTGTNNKEEKFVGELAETNQVHEVVKVVIGKKGELLSENTIISNKVAGVVAKIKELQKNNIEVTDEEINLLLRNAQREITTEEYIKSSKISASTLLQDVEDEIDETFKQRVFEALKTGFEKVRTAVAEREN